MPELSPQTWMIVLFEGQPTEGPLPATLRFEPDGLLSGSTGYRRFLARYAAGDKVLAIDAITVMETLVSSAPDERLLATLPTLQRVESSPSGFVALCDDVGEVIRLVPMG